MPMGIRMLKYCSDKLAEILVDNCGLNAEMTEVYSYGLELTISIFLSVISIIVGSLFINLFVGTLFYTLCFLALRVYSGGYHADTHLRCYIVFIATYAAVVLVYKYSLYIPFSEVFYHIAAAAAIVLIFLLAPCEDKNKPLDDNETAKYKKRSRIIVVLLWAVSLLIYLIFKNQEIYFFSVLGIFATALTLPASIIKKILARQT